MPHATITLIPGIDTNQTPALNQAGFSQSNLIRFKPDRNGKGLVEKMGGWLQYTTIIFNKVSEIWAWEDLSSVKRLAVGDESGLFYLNSTDKNTKKDITPQINSSDSPFLVSQPITTFVAGTTNTISTTTPVSNGLAVVFANSGGALPSGITAGTIYYTLNSVYSSGSWTFQISTSSTGSPIVSFTTTGSGTSTFSFQIAVAVSGSNVVTIYDTGLGVADVTFSSNIITVGTDSTNLNAASAPLTGSSVKFYGTSLPAGITAGTSYYAFYLTDKTYSLSTTYPTNTPVTFGAGSGKQFIPNQILSGYSVNFETPIVASNLILSGVFTVSQQNTNTLYNVYQINTSINASTTSAGALISFGLVSGSTTVVVNQNGHPYINGITTTFLWPTISNGVTIYGSYIVFNAATNSYNITASSTAGSTITVYMNSLSNGNAYAHMQYTYNVQAPFATSGYGTGGYGVGGYGVGSVSALSNIPGKNVTSVDWALTNFGEILVANPEGGAIYYWSPTANTQNANLLASAPQKNQGVFVSMPARQLVAYGSTVTGIQDPLLVRWSDLGSLTNWTPTPTNQAGSYRIPEGSMIVRAIQGPQQALIWTDISLWAMQYVGGQAVYGFNKISEGSGAISKKCVGVMNGIVYWMSPNKFMMLSGNGPEVIPCSVWDRVFQNLCWECVSLIRCATNSVFNEITWYYPSKNNIIVDSYVKYNTVNQTWDYGILDRTAWIDQSILGTPIGASTNGTLFQHEQGYNNGTLPMLSSFQTGYIQLNEADNVVFVDQVWPDFKWQTVNNFTPPATMYLTFYGTNYPGDTPTEYGPYPITQNTEYVNTRIRNRLLSIGISTSPDGTQPNAQPDIFYRIGAMRYRYQIDGKF